MVYLTADIHGDVNIKKITRKVWPKQHELTRNDYLIICGDYGLIWRNDKTFKYLMDFYTSRKYTILACPGNHENFTWLYTLPIVSWHNGKVYQVADNIFYAKHGEIYDIDNYKFLFIGGALSIDKEYRIYQVSWWLEEELNYQDQLYTLNNLDKYNWSVDYVITHAAPASILLNMFPNKHEFNGQSATEKFLDYIYQNICFKQWYFGHYHIDCDYLNLHCLYNRVLSLHKDE